MKRKILFSLVLITIVVSPLFSQGSAQGIISPDKNLLSGNPDLKFGLEAGTSFSTYGSGFSLFSNQVSPYLNYQVNPKLSLEIGTTFSTYNTGNTPVFSLSGNNYGTSFTGISGYAVGRYQASERLTFTGSVFRQSSVMPSLTLNPGAFEFLNQGMSMGFDYKISDRFSFGAGIQMNQTNAPWGVYSTNHRNPFFRQGGF